MNQVGQYTLLKNIGSGQFGHAYMVRHAITGRTLCMKQISITAEVPFWEFATLHMTTCCWQRNHAEAYRIKSRQ